MDLPEPSGPGDSGVGDAVLQPAPDTLDRIVVRAVPSAMQQLQPGLFVQVAGDGAAAAQLMDPPSGGLSF